MQDLAGDADDRFDERIPLGYAVTARVALKTSADLVSVSVAPGADRGVAADGPLGSAGGFDFLQQRGLIVLQLDDEASLRLCGGLEGFFWQCMASRVTMLCATWSSPATAARRGFRWTLSAISTCARTETGFDVEGVQHLGRLAVGEIVEASSECLAIDRDDTSRRIGNGAAQTSGVLAENLVDRLGIKALEDVSNRGMGWGRAASADQGRRRSTGGGAL